MPETNDLDICLAALKEIASSTTEQVSYLRNVALRCIGLIDLDEKLRDRRKENAEFGGRVFICQTCGMSMNHDCANCQRLWAS